MGFVTNRWQPVSSPGPTPVVPVRYGVKFRPTGLASNTQLTYVFDAVGMTSATLTTSGFSWGSWENTVLGKSFYPAVTTNRNLVTSIDYKLDPNDYTKKIDGTASNITSPAGNVVSVFEGGWISIYNQADSGTTYTYVVWSNIQYDSSYVAFHRLQSGNVLHKGFTVGCYLSDSNSFTATKSVSGSTFTSVTKPSINEQTNTLITYYQLQYIHYLSMIMFRTIDFHTFSWQYNAQGSQNDKGLFNLTDVISGQCDTKIFGIENLLCSTSRNGTLLKGSGLRVPKMSSSSVTQVNATHILYDYSTNSWVDVLTTRLNKSSLNQMFTNVYASTFNPNATGAYYSSINPLNYGLIPTTFTRTTTTENELYYMFQISPNTSKIVYSYACLFYKFTNIIINSYSTINFNLRYASFLD